MAKAKHKCEHCDFKAKSAGGLKTYTRSKHNANKRHDHFDLHIDTPEKANELIAHLTNLKMTAGWAMMCQIFKGNIAVIEEMILSKEGSDGNKLTEAEVDHLRDRRSIMQEMIQKPDYLIHQYKLQVGDNMPTYDPYAVDVEQFGKPHRGKEMASPLQ